jgi:5-(carboxyamino)imidazole ribonucleotide synthase
MVKKKTFNDAVEIARELAQRFEYVGTMCVEFFVKPDGEILVNEIAPRPHNSGHLTFGPCVTSQFEQQLRAVCGLPLGSTEFYRPAAIANLLGDIWEAGEPDWPAAISGADVKLHLYGKSEPRPGRKMGHLIATAATATAAAGLVRRARCSLTGG